MAPKGQGDGKFTNVTEDAGLKDAPNGASITWGDYDNDNDLDLYIGNGGWSEWWNPGPNKFYRNNGDGTFTEITKEIGLGDNIGSSPQSGFADYDNDGNLDFYLYNPIWGPNGISRIFLYHNDGKGKFIDVTDKAGIKTPEDFFCLGGGFVDYNNDGNVDLFFTPRGTPQLLYRNDGDGTFTNVSDEAGLGLINSELVSVWGDYDNDGDMDLFIAGGNVFGEKSSFYENMGNGTFKDVTQKAGILFSSHSAVFLDYDNDGDLDIYTVDGTSSSCLYRNNGNKTFTNVAWEAGAGLPHGERVAACDYDNDGYMDIYAMQWMDSGRFLFHNNGDGTFTNVARELGIIPDGPANGCSFADYDNDGFLDLFSSSLWQHSLYHNEGNDNNWLKIKAVGSIGDIPINIKRTNKDGIGSRITVQAGKLSMMREINTGCSRGYISTIAQFGLGQNSKIDKMVIRWTSGQVTELQDIQANQFLVIKEGVGIIDTIETKPRPKGVEPDGKATSTWGKLKENKLYQNFPNPFNPETWIPYQISKPSEVTIKIYEESGRLIRTLDLGIKKEGLYLSGSQSAYWDGKNEEDESVSSGVYFYTIKAGDFVDTKKMIVQK
ncbi:MAG: FG-GAP-like repeat-containing protein, partial [Candidatus Poribacteria bacterium]